MQLGGKMEFQTRLVDARLNIEFEILSDELNLIAEEEYNKITQMHNLSIDSWLNSLKSKSTDCKCGGGSIILGEMLVQIYKKLEHIENLISGEELKYITLKNINFTSKLGHGIIVLNSNCIQPSNKYYARLFLPIFPARCVPLFGVAIESNVLRIDKIGDRDLKDYDKHIVNIEREMLKSRKKKSYKE